MGDFFTPSAVKFPQFGCTPHTVKFKNFNAPQGLAFF